VQILKGFVEVYKSYCSRKCKVQASFLVFEKLAKNCESPFAFFGVLISGKDFLPIITSMYNLSLRTGATHKCRVGILNIIYAYLCNGCHQGWRPNFTNAGFARNPTRLGEARFPSPHADDVRAPRYSRGV